MLGLGTSINKGGFVSSGPESLFLDEYSGAAVAYSLRKLSNTYSGPALQVRRESDNVEVDVSFDTDGVVSLDSAVTNVTEETSGSSQGSTTATSLGEFVANASYTDTDNLGSTDTALVQCWYDQSGNSNNATQNAAGNQPQIVSSGAVIVENGKPAVEFNNNYLSMTSDTSPLAGFMTMNPTSVAGGRAYIGGTSSSDLFGPESTTGLRYRRSSTNYITSDLSPTGYHIFSFVGTGSSVSIYQDGTGSTDNPFSAGALSGINQIFRRQSLYIIDGTAQEIILYETAQSDNRTNIESNIATFYGITI